MSRYIYYTHAISPFSLLDDAENRIEFVISNKRWKCHAKKKSRKSCKGYTEKSLALNLAVISFKGKRHVFVFIQFIEDQQNVYGQAMYCKPTIISLY